MFKHLSNFYKTSMHPELYHGEVMSAPFFEGWYFKVVDASGEQRFAFIPGVFVGKTAADSHAFVQVLEGASSRVAYHRYPIDEFEVADDPFELRIGQNVFRLDSIQLNIAGSEQSVRGELKFQKPVGWPVRLVSPGIMGWYAWVPKMECYHGVLGFDHEVRGAIKVDGNCLNFDGGKGYIEKDWGKAFPQAWVWMQSNHFSHPRTCLTASVAIIPWLGNAFAGFIVGLWQDGKLHRFATYANSRIQGLEVNDQEVHWQMRNRTHRLEIVATQAEGGLLQAPTPEGMGRRIAETLNASIFVRLINRKTGLIEFEDQGRYAGLEAVGDLDQLIRMAVG
jgi:hypothetical protein